jgi:hypothetical protein
MAWSYSGDPNKSPLDRVRFLCGDTDINDQLLSDEEINFLLSIRSTPERAAEDACIAIMAKLAREVDYAIGPEKVSAKQRLDNYKRVLDEMRAARIRTVAAPSWQGPSQDDSPPVFDIGMHDYRDADGDDLDG